MSITEKQHLAWVQVMSLPDIVALAEELAVQAGPEAAWKFIQGQLREAMANWPSQEQIERAVSDEFTLMLRDDLMEAAHEANA